MNSRRAPKQELGDPLIPQEQQQLLRDQLGQTPPMSHMPSNVSAAGGVETPPPQHFVSPDEGDHASGERGPQYQAQAQARSPPISSRTMNIIGRAAPIPEDASSEVPMDMEDVSVVFDMTAIARGGANDLSEDEGASSFIADDFEEMAGRGGPLFGAQPTTPGSNQPGGTTFIDPYLGTEAAVATSGSASSTAVAGGGRKRKGAPVDSVTAGQEQGDLKRRAGRNAKLSVQIDANSLETGVRNYFMEQRGQNGAGPAEGGAAQPILVRGVILYTVYMALNKASGPQQPTIPGGTCTGGELGTGTAASSAQLHKEAIDVKLSDIKAHFAAKLGVPKHLLQIRNQWTGELLMSERISFDTFQDMQVSCDVDQEVRKLLVEVLIGTGKVFGARTSLVLGRDHMPVVSQASDLFRFPETADAPLLPVFEGFFELQGSFSDIYVEVRRQWEVLFGSGQDGAQQEGKLIRQQLKPKGEQKTRILQYKLALSTPNDGDQLAAQADQIRMDQTAPASSEKELLAPTGLQELAQGQELLLWSHAASRKGSGDDMVTEKLYQSLYHALRAEEKRKRMGHLGYFEEVVTRDDAELRQIHEAAHALQDLRPKTQTETQVGLQTGSNPLLFASAASIRNMDSADINKMFNERLSGSVNAAFPGIFVYTDNVRKKTYGLVSWWYRKAIEKQKTVVRAGAEEEEDTRKAGRRTSAANITGGCEDAASGGNDDSTMGQGGQTQGSPEEDSKKKGEHISIGPRTVLRALRSVRSATTASTGSSNPLKDRLNAFLRGGRGTTTGASSSSMNNPFLQAVAGSGLSQQQTQSQAEDVSSAAAAADEDDDQTTSPAADGTGDAEKKITSSEQQMEKYFVYEYYSSIGLSDSAAAFLQSPEAQVEGEWYNPGMTRSGASGSSASGGDRFHEFSGAFTAGSRDGAGQGSGSRGGATPGGSSVCSAWPSIWGGSANVPVGGSSCTNGAASSSTIATPQNGLMNASVTTASTSFGASLSTGSCASGAANNVMCNSFDWGPPGSTGHGDADHMSSDPNSCTGGSTGGPLSEVGHTSLASARSASNLTIGQFLCNRAGSTSSRATSVGGFGTTGFGTPVCLTRQLSNDQEPRLSGGIASPQVSPPPAYAFGAGGQSSSAGTTATIDPASGSAGGAPFAMSTSMLTQPGPPRVLGRSKSEASAVTSQFQHPPTAPAAGLTQSSLCLTQSSFRWGDGATSFLQQSTQQPGAPPQAPVQQEQPMASQEQGAPVQALSSSRSGFMQRYGAWTTSLPATTQQNTFMTLGTSTTQRFVTSVTGTVPPWFQQHPTVASSVPVPHATSNPNAAQQAQQATYLAATGGSQTASHPLLVAGMPQGHDFGIMLPPALQSLPLGGAASSAAHQHFERVIPPTAPAQRKRTMEVASDRTAAGTSSAPVPRGVMLLRQHPGGPEESPVPTRAVVKVNPPQGQHFGCFDSGTQQSGTTPDQKMSNNPGCTKIAGASCASSTSLSGLFHPPASSPSGAFGAPGATTGSAPHGTLPIVGAPGATMGSAPQHGTTLPSIAGGRPCLFAQQQHQKALHPLLLQQVQHQHHLEHPGTTTSSQPQTSRCSVPSVSASCSTPSRAGQQDDHVLDHQQQQHFQDYVDAQHQHLVRPPQPVLLPAQVVNRQRGESQDEDDFISSSCKKKKLGGVTPFSDDALTSQGLSFIPPNEGLNHPFLNQGAFSTGMVQQHAAGGATQGDQVASSGAGNMPQTESSVRFLIYFSVSGSAFDADEQDVDDDSV
ncbi:unnamed protein product [Amoebophrya sp. A25]|nr:unnamed protein product [Amoebophrya sp. A25]|eukprot:GSA25T00009706001.1